VEVSKFLNFMIRQIIIVFVKVGQFWKFPLNKFSTILYCCLVSMWLSETCITQTHTNIFVFFLEIGYTLFWSVFLPDHCEM